MTTITRFEGFGQEVRDWFRGLAADNNQEYFSARRDFFEEAIRDQLYALLTELSRTFGDVWGETLATAPRGYSIEHPRI